LSAARARSVSLGAARAKQENPMTYHTPIKRQVVTTAKGMVRLAFFVSSDVGVAASQVIDSRAMGRARKMPDAPPFAVVGNTGSHEKLPFAIATPQKGQARATTTANSVISMTNARRDDTMIPR